MRSFSSEGGPTFRCRKGEYRSRSSGCLSCGATGLLAWNLGPVTRIDDRRICFPLSGGILVLVRDS